MNPGLLLHWQYLIFIAPFGLAAFLLLLSSMRFGHGHAAAHAGHGGHGAAHSVAHAGAAGHSAGGSHVGAHSGGHGPHQTAAHTHHGAGPRHHAGPAKPGANGANPAHLLAALFGVGRAPLPMLIEAFFLSWGLSGCIAAQLILKSHDPGIGQMLPVLAVAMVCGLIGARASAEVIARIMPQEETLVVSRESLYGLKGKVAFPVTESGGRVMIYDDYGSLHDEHCRVAPGHAPIERGRRAMVMDRDAQGNLLVEEVAE